MYFIHQIQICKEHMHNQSCSKPTCNTREPKDCKHSFRENLGAGDQTLSTLMPLMQAMMVINALDVKIVGLI